MDPEILKLAFCWNWSINISPAPCLFQSVDCFLPLSQHTAMKNRFLTNLAVWLGVCARVCVSVCARACVCVYVWDLQSDIRGSVWCIRLFLSIPLFHFLFFSFFSPTFSFTSLSLLILGISLLPSFLPSISTFWLTFFVSFLLHPLKIPKFPRRIRPVCSVR